MASFLKAGFLATIVLGVLLSFGHVYSAPASMDEVIARFQIARANAQMVDPPTPEATLPFATPTLALPVEASPSASATPSETVTTAPSATGTPTLVPASPIGDTSTPSDTLTPSVEATGTPSASATPTPLTTETTTPEATETVIGPEGGNITSLDGDAEITFPPGAIDEPVLVRVTQKESWGASC